MLLIAFLFVGVGTSVVKSDDGPFTIAAASAEWIQQDGSKWTQQDGSDWITQ